MYAVSPFGDHKLIVDFNRYCLLEKATGKKMPEPILAFKLGVGFGFEDLRTYIRIFLDKPMTDAEVGDLIASLGQREIPVPKQLRKKGDPETDLVWVAALILDETIDAAKPVVQGQEKVNPPLAA